MSDCRPVFTALLGLALSVGCLAGALCPGRLAPPVEAPERAAEYPRTLGDAKALATCGELHGGGTARTRTATENQAVLDCFARYSAGTCGGDLECETFYGGQY